MEFQSWNGTFIICPDLTNIKSFAISDDGYGLKISVINSYFKKCNNNTTSCKSDSEITKFLSDLRIKLYSWN
jgi:hypothetical protein